ncbi:IS3 family transposase [Psychrobacillus glaciei]|uniref:IS3 family transposase n=1 Tax=Psychrobacillus glaciei TaxID=2283160 RepID=UPI0021F47D8F|nr:IS3 family transposase [Psychrobacillus glaciei]
MRKDYPVSTLCKTLKVSTSGYYNYIAQPQKSLSERDQIDSKVIQSLYDYTGGTIGVKRIAGKLKENHNHIINHKRVSRLMYEMNIKSKIRVKKYFRSKKDAQSNWIYPNLLNRYFDAPLPNRKWVTDLSEITVEEEKFYVSAIMYLCNREIIAFKMSDSPTAALVEATVKQAMKTRELPDLTNIIIHSDQGSVYKSFKYKNLAKKLQFSPSMFRKANCWDKAVIESFFSHLKTEFPHLYATDNAKQVRKDLLLYIAYFNENRGQKRLGYLSPTAYLKLKHSAS